MRGSLRTVCPLFFLLLATAAWGQVYRPSGTAAAETTYILGVHPYTNPQSMLEDYDPVVRYLESKNPGARFQIEASKDYPDYEAKLAARRFHFSLPNPYQTVLSLEHGYRVIAKMTPDENFRGLIVARADSGLKTPRDLNGKTVCFPSATAVAATMLPLLYLHQQGVDMKSLKIRHVGSQDSSILNAYAGDAVACGSTVRFFGSWAKKDGDKAREMKILWRTDSLPHNGFVARDDVDKALASRVAQSLAAMDKDPALDQAQFKKDQQHFELANDDTYRPMRNFLRDYDRAIGLPATMRPLGER
ncbi:MAG: phosphate/phosphite/phosphonate ABC transporter substrate-binding protein [Betaproteobacteria bacterium]|nr:phosphate/phosphite/phosphonate ABC transporter substrate-binding protein [Betaproteobacteria bacterium]